MITVNNFMSIIKKKILSKIYSGYGLKYYPKKFQINLKSKSRFKINKKNSININKRYEKISLASIDIKVNPVNIWNKKNFKDREDLSSLHRWTWALKLISKKKKILNFKKKKFFKFCFFNFFVNYS